MKTEKEMDKNLIYIFDLDGTLANINHRRHFVEDGNHDWENFYKECIHDTPNIDVLRLFNILSQEYDCIIFSGRCDSVREETEEWLRKYFIIPRGGLYMRKKGDNTPDEILKKNWIKEFPKDRVAGIFDDRNKVVKMWRDEGYTCFQVANFEG